MTDAEAVYTAQEAGHKIELAHAAIRACLDNFDQTPFGQLDRFANEMELHLHVAEKAEAELKSALSKIKVRETADAQ